MWTRGKPAKYARLFTKENQQFYAFTVPYNATGTKEETLNDEGKMKMKEARLAKPKGTISGEWCFAPASEWRASPRIDYTKWDSIRPQYSKEDVVILQASPFYITSAVILWEKKNLSSDFAYTCYGHVYRITGQQLEYDAFMKKFPHFNREKINK